MGGEDQGGVDFGVDAGVEDAVLKNGGCVSHDEVDGAVDVAFAVELAARGGPKGVLEALEGAIVERGLVSCVQQGYSLARFGPSRIHEGYS